MALMMTRCLVFLAVVSSMASVQGEREEPDGDSLGPPLGAVRLVVDALLLRKVQTVVAYTCWTGAERWMLRALSGSGASLRLLHGASLASVAGVRMALGGEGRGGQRVAGLVDAGCPAAPRLLAMLSRLRLFSKGNAWLVLEPGLLSSGGPAGGPAVGQDFADWDSVPRHRYGAQAREDALGPGDVLLMDVAAPGARPARDDDVAALRPARPTARLSPPGEALLADHVILTDSDVWWAQRDGGDDGVVGLYSVFRTSLAGKPQAFKVAGGDLDDGSWNSTQSLADELLVEQRKTDLEGASIRAPIVVTYPKDFTHIEDNSRRKYDVFIKFSFPVIKNIAEKMNFNLLLLRMSDYGYNRDAEGNFDGAMGTLQRYESDMMGSALQAREERMAVMDLVAETFVVSTGAVYRQTTPPSPLDLYLRPFARPVWACLAALAALCVLLLLATTQCWTQRLAAADRRVGPWDCVTFVVVVICQQGSPFTPSATSTRVTLASLLIATMFIFTSYSASILSLTQAPHDPLRSPKELLESNLGLGAENTPWEHHWFKNDKTPEVNALFAKKIKTHSRPGFLEPVEGIQKIRKGGFAFQVELNAAFLEIQESFLETEKCDIHVLELFPKIIQVLVTVKKSPYTEAMSRTVRWQRETGLMDRVHKRWATARPRCTSSTRSFTPLDVREVSPPLQLLASGAVLACAFLALENAVNAVKALALLLHHQRHRQRSQREQP